MSRYKITVGYDGTHYCGWQVQPNVVTVQGCLETALLRLEEQPVKVHGSGRTDQGVHAVGQVAHFDIEKPFTEQTLWSALNALIPDDIRVMRVDSVPFAFHARKHTRDKTYRYFIWNRKNMPPTLRLYQLHVPERLDIDAMREAAMQLQGQHDFAAFTSNSRVVVEDTVRNLFELQVRKSGSEITIVVRGDGFLYKMVRALTGWLLRVGKGEADPSETERILQSNVRTARVPTAPARGLFLWNVRYQKKREQR